jgi:hypothetical protein
MGLNHQKEVSRPELSPYHNQPGGKAMGQKSIAKQMIQLNKTGCENYKSLVDDSDAKVESFFSDSK